MTDLPMEERRRRATASRHEATLARARAAGLLGDSKNGRIAGRVSERLVTAAKKRTGLVSDTDLIEVALATLALEDDFGAKLVRRKGSIPKELDLGV